MAQPEFERFAEIAADPSSLAATPAPGTIAKPDSPRRRRWYQFSLWSLFGLTLLAALALLGWRWAIAPYRTEARTMALVERLGGSYQSAPAPRWMSRVAGEELGNVTLVNLADCDQPDEYLDAVALLPTLQILVVGGKAFADEHVQQLAATKSLRWLVLDSTRISDNALKDIAASNPNLRAYRSQRRAMAAAEAAGAHLSWQDNRDYPELIQLIGADFFRQAYFLEGRGERQRGSIAELTTLTYVFPLGPISDEELAEISKLPAAEGMGLHDASQVTDEGVRHIADMPRLHSLSLYGGSITNEGLGFLAKKTELRGLGLSATHIGDAGLAHIGRLANLEVLSLDGTNVTDAGISHLHILTKLKTLELSRTKVSDVGLAGLEGRMGLERLHLAETQITDAGLKSVGAMRSLGDLQIGKTSISDDGLQNLKSLDGLKQLGIDRTNVTDVGVSHLTGLKKVMHLNLIGTKITDASVEHLRALASLTQLDVRNTRITDEGVAKLQKALPKCRIFSGALPTTQTPATAGGSKK